VGATFAIVDSSDCSRLLHSWNSNPDNFNHILVSLFEFIPTQHMAQFHSRPILSLPTFLFHVTATEWLLVFVLTTEERFTKGRTSSITSNGM
jgi:hypothetical protein